MTTVLGLTAPDLAETPLRLGKLRAVAFEGDRNRRGSAPAKVSKAGLSLLAKEAVPVRTSRAERSGRVWRGPRLADPRSALALALHLQVASPKDEHTRRSGFPAENDHKATPRTETQISRLR
jgi:hypothetical protein